MTRGEMRTLVRDLLLDTDSNNPRYTDAQIDRRLNLDAKAIGRMLDTHGKIHLTKGTETFNSVSGTLRYELVSTTIRRVYGLWQLDADSNRYLKGRQIAESEVEAHDCAFDGRHWLYYVTRATDDGLFSINFPYDPYVNETFSVDFYTTVADIATGSGNDSSSYSTLPNEFHELVCARSARLILGPDKSHYGPVLQYEKELENELMRDVSYGDSPRQIAQEY